MKTCQCDWKYHRGEECVNVPAEHEGVQTSQELCTPCLYVCAQERESAENPWSSKR